MAQNEAVALTSPVGRLVQGDPWTPRTVDINGEPLRVKSGQNKGQETQQFFVGIAIEKSNPELAAYHQAIRDVAKRDWAALFAAGDPPHFAWKIQDGDTAVDGRGQPLRDRTGCAGCMIFKYSSSFAPKVFGIGPNLEVTDHNALKRGYYVQIGGTVTGNGSTLNPGLFLNLNMIKIIGYGEVIAGGPNPDEVFAGTPGYVPAGMSRTPIAGGSALPTPPAAPTPAPAAPPAAPAPAPAAPPPAPPAPPPYGGYMQAPPQMTAAATATYDAYIGAGWTEEVLIREGLMLPRV